MTQRLAFRSILPDVTRGFSQAGRDAQAAGLEPRLKHLIDVRASQMNGCAFCLDLHVEEWKHLGEPEEKLHFIAVWREAGDVFTAKERAGLEWTEAVTDVIGSGIPDDVYARVREQFSDEELIALTVAISAINAHNRMNLAFRTPVGAMRKAGTAR
jgi:AhpD family alkylhydroperoxidase